MTVFGETFTATGGVFLRLALRVVKSKPISIFGLFLMLTILFGYVAPFISFLLIFPTYLSGVILVLWLFTFFPPAQE